MNPLTALAAVNSATTVAFTRKASNMVQPRLSPAIWPLLEQRGL